MSNKKRFICGLGFPINSDEPIRIITDSVKDKDYYKFSDICKLLNKYEDMVKQKDRELDRLYNYFEDYLKDEISPERFSEMWDNVKRDKRWKNEPKTI